MQRLLRVNVAAFWRSVAVSLAALTGKRPPAALRVSTRLALAGVLALACSHPVERPVQMEYASWFRVLDSSRVVVLSPAGGADTLTGPVQSLVCMSTSYVGFLEAIGADSVVTAVSGLSFLGNEKVRSRAVEAGYDAALDFEALLRVRPDLFLTYAVGATEPLYMGKLKEMGIRAVILSEHLESHPLARAEYVKLFGVLTGRLQEADSVFNKVKERYLSLKQDEIRHRVLVNIPYADSWYIPGGDNYMTTLMRDAGAEILGAVPLQQESSVISLETAYQYAQEADFWLHPGWCRTKAQLKAVHPLFEKFPVLEGPVWNNTLQTTPEGGNRYWETGPVRPDLLLEDLVRLFSADTTSAPYHYYQQVN